MTFQICYLSLVASRKTAKKYRQLFWLKMLAIQTCALFKQPFLSNIIPFIIQ